jgi:hypothetical protein
VRRALFEILTVILLGGSLVFFYECLRHVSRRDYVGSLILLAIGLSVLHVGKELARLALVQRE